MRTAPSLDRVLVGCLLVLVAVAACLSFFWESGTPVQAQVSAACGNSTSGETYDACTTNADCPIGICSGGLCTEQCDGGACCATDCRFKPGDAICRAKSGACDSAERCSGTSATCGSDALLSAGTICRAAAGVCDSAERCDGVTINCPADNFVNYAICRQAKNACDVTESCSGGTPQCPPDLYQPQGLPCGTPEACRSPACDGNGRCAMIPNVDGMACVLGDGKIGGCRAGTCQAVSSAASVTSSSVLSASPVLSSFSSFSSSVPLASSAPASLPASLCGNGISDENEQCEDGNVRDGDGCTSDCRFEPLYCCRGGGRVVVPTAARERRPTLAAGSLCSDFDAAYDQVVSASRDFNDACLCGNDSLDPGEQCDGRQFAPLADGAEPTCASQAKWTIGELGCAADCTLDTAACQLAVCGDSRLAPGEECDDKGQNTVACDSDCSFPVCGDGLVNPAAGEECDDAWENVDGVSGACRTDCTLAVCGDGIVDVGEQCDDANDVVGDGCTANCALETFYCCELGERQAVKREARLAVPAEARVGGDCAALDPAFDINSTVTLNPDAACACGDGELQLYEWCDGNLFARNGDGLSLNECANVPWLGPEYRGTVACAPDCTIDDRACRAPACGDGSLDPGEACDGGLFAPGLDGVVRTSCQEIFGSPQRGEVSCREDCLVDTSLCQPMVCGDGKVDPGEECDGGGVSQSCDADCTLAQCGDGVVNKTAGEACDDGNRNDDYLAGACRTDCQPAACGDGILDPGEECDDGNQVDGDGCSPGCRGERIRQCNPAVCADCGGALFCTRAICQSYGCRPGPTDALGSFFSFLGNPLGFESHRCDVEPQCNR